MACEKHGVHRCAECLRYHISEAEKGTNDWETMEGYESLTKRDGHYGNEDLEKKQMPELNGVH